MARARQERPHSAPNIELLVRELISAGVAGLNETIDFAEERARELAPVRATFKRDRRGPEYPRVHTRATTKAGVLRAYRAQAINTAAQYERWSRSRSLTRRIDTPRQWKLGQLRGLGGMLEDPGTRRLLQEEESARFGFEGAPTGPMRRRRGGANTEFPVFRSHGVSITGDFREVRGGKLVPVAAIRYRNGKSTLMAPPQGRSIAGFMLTVAGGREVKSGRANIEVGGVEQVGGALKHSIKQVPASLTSRDRRGRIIGYVTAGNEDVGYARYQEFGTRHHRAQPFLRPALYEARNVFKERVKVNLRGEGGR